MPNSHRTFTTRQLRSLDVDDLRCLLDRKDSRQLAYNTRLECDPDGSIGVRLHRSRIITFHRNDTFTVSSGGYETVTTKQRLNALLPPGFSIFARSYRWYISTPEGVFPFV